MKPKKESLKKISKLVTIFWKTDEGCPREEKRPSYRLDYRVFTLNLATHNGPILSHLEEKKTPIDLVTFGREEGS